MRGHQTLYSSLFPSAVNTETSRKGQRNVLIEQRDNALACRYYYHAQIMRRRYDDCLLHISSEFFITPSVIVQRLQDRQLLIKDLVNKKATVAALKKEYPHFAW